MSALNIKFRKAKVEDLEKINRVIEAAVMTWELPERVKRLSLTSYRYTAMDFEHLEMLVAEAEQYKIVGIAAWEPAARKDIPAGYTALLLHGIYVDPKYQHQGVGQRLLQGAEQTAAQAHYDGLLVKAQTDAEGFFMAQGMKRLSVENAERHYARRFWKKVSNA